MVSGGSSISRHSYVGPGGGIGSGSVGAGQAGKEGVAIQKPQRPAPTALNGSPLTSSIQENFRGFTYTGESLMVCCPACFLSHSGSGSEEI